MWTSLCKEWQEAEKRRLAPLVEAQKGFRRWKNARPSRKPHWFGDTKREWVLYIASRRADMKWRLDRARKDIVGGEPEWIRPAASVISQAMLKTHAITQARWLKKSWSVMCQGM